MPSREVDPTRRQVLRHSGMQCPLELMIIFLLPPIGGWNALRWENSSMTHFKTNYGRSTAALHKGSGETELISLKNRHTDPNRTRFHKLSPQQVQTSPDHQDLSLL